MVYIRHKMVIPWILFIALMMLPSAEAGSFVIDYDHDGFLKDGQPFRYISGSLHYFRVPRVHWQDRIDKFVAAGLNTIQTYVEWSSHEPESEQFNFEDGLDLLHFLQLVNQSGLLVILRPGPYICAERDFGGLPYWLLHDDPNIELRSSDPIYLKYVDRWWDKLFGLIGPMLYINGGPIISIQVENEYGSLKTCDSIYTTHLRDRLRSTLVGQDVVLFTTDGGSDGYLRCGKIPGVYATVDFGDSQDVDASFRAQRDFEPRGPYVNSEYYTGWLDLWGSPHIQKNVSSIAGKLDAILARNASVNMYMFHGGSNFAFTSGALLNDGNVLKPVPTSYDYDAPLSEAGDPGELYAAIRDVIAKYTDVPPGAVPPATPKRAYGPVHLTPAGSFFELLQSVAHGPSRYVDFPITFEELGQAYGFVLYSIRLDDFESGTALLEVPGVRDRGYVFVDMESFGILSRMDGVYSLNITFEAHQMLMILVENQGRVNAGPGLKDFKGIVSNVTLMGTVLRGWIVSSIPMNGTMEAVAPSNDVSASGDFPTKINGNGSSYLPRFYAGDFLLPEGEEPADTFLDPTGWRKGVAFVNDFNLGRYWPVMGPQVTLFVPKSLLHANPQVNRLVVAELEGPPETTTPTMTFTDVANVDGPVAFNNRSRPLHSTVLH